jgi:predicted nuclease of predicted toxin-antitoxin system
MKLLFDQNVSASAAALLRSEGLDVWHARDVGLAVAEDDVILDWCRSHGRWIVTHDADFHALLAVTAARAPSVIRIRIEGLRDQALATLIRRVLHLVEEDLQRGSAVTVTPNAVRVRALPLSGGASRGKS